MQRITNGARCGGATSSSPCISRYRAKFARVMRKGSGLVGIPYNGVTKPAVIETEWSCRPVSFDFCFTGFGTS